MNEIGGYFEIEFDQKTEYHKNCLRLNSGRNCFETILINRKYKHLFLPRFICETLFEPLRNHNIDYTFYDLDKNLEPILENKNYEAGVLLINYFGLKDLFIDKMCQKSMNIIVDNSQAFYSLPNPGIDTFYSPRKFFGVPDGGYLFSNLSIEVPFTIEKSLPFSSHLFIRMERDAVSGFEDFKRNETAFSIRPVAGMSILSRNILSSINYKKIKQKRDSNFNFLHSKLKMKNELEFDSWLGKDFTPMVYPFLFRKENLRELLATDGIFVSTYWPNVTRDSDSKSWEYYLSKYLFPIPIDQRYGPKEMQYIIEKLRKIIS